MLPGRPGSVGWVAADIRVFLDTVPDAAKTGVPWRYLPTRFGTWNAAYKRLDRWSRKGTWRRVFDALQNPDMGWLILEWTIIRARPCAAGAAKGGDRDAQALGRSRGGFGTKIYVAVTGLGLPTAVGLSPGRDADVTHAGPVLGDARPAVVVADKGYDSRALVRLILARGADAVIPVAEEQHHPAGDRRGPVQGPEPGRAVLGEGEAVPASRDPLRKDRPELPGVRFDLVMNRLQ